MKFSFLNIFFFSSSFEIFTLLQSRKEDKSLGIKWGLVTASPSLSSSHHSEMACSTSTIPSLEEVEVMMTAEETEAMKKCMFKNAMKGLWDDVLAQYKKPQAQELRITRTGDTVLHLAVFDGEHEIVQKLVRIISGDQASKILKLKNKIGNTVLHLAASLGYVEMCECIAVRDRSLIGERNEDNETPLFLAAHHGQKEAFLCLNSKCASICDGLLYCRRRDGETVLHCAINGEYFDLAYQIIRIYGDLVNYNNERGLSPLHILASKPNAFKSGNRLRRFDLLIYYCIFVDCPDSNPTKYKCRDADRVKNFDKENGSKYCPRNYKICYGFFEIFKKLIMVIALSIRNKQVTHAQTTDTENPELIQETSAAQQGGSVCGRQNEQKNQSNTKKNTQWPDHHQSNGATMASLPPPPKIYPPNCNTCFYFFELAMKTLLVILGLGFSRVRKIREKKEKNTWATRIMEELIVRASDWEYDTYAGGDPGKLQQSQPKHIEPGETTPFNADDLQHSMPPPNAAADPPPPGETKDKKGEGKMDSPILIAAKMGVIEMVEKLLDKFPMAIQDMNAEKKNIVLLAVENRQPHVYELLLNRKILNESVFRQVDNKGNSALHLAATLGEYRPWLIPGAALQMQWEIRWYKFVKDSKPRNYFVRYNIKGKTAKQVFSETHKDLVKDGGSWLTNTSQSCSLVAALIATVAFATAATVPGGLNSTTGTPTLEGEPAFDAFAISSLVALCFSVTGVIMFLAILTSRYEEKDFASDLPHKLLLGLSSLFISIASMLVSFCTGHFFVLKDKVRYAAYPMYAVTCLPVAFFVAAQFPLYVDLIRATIKKVPQRSYKVIPIDVERVAYLYMEHGSVKKPQKKKEKSER